MAPGGRPAGGGGRDRAGRDYQQFLSCPHSSAVHGLAHRKRAVAGEHSGRRGARRGTRWVGAGVPLRPDVTAQTLAFMRIVVSGYYGFGNGGDEAVLEAIVGALRARLPQAQLVVLSAAPDQTRLLHGVAGVAAHHRARPPVRRGSPPGHAGPRSGREPGGAPPRGRFAGLPRRRVLRRIAGWVAGVLPGDRGSGPRARVSS